MLLLMTTDENPCADIPPPPGATIVGDWERNTGGGWSRSLVWASYGDEDPISVDITGRQEHDGTYTRQISMWLDEGGALDAAAARRLAAHLLNAADLLDG